MAITDLTGYTWVGNETITLSPTGTYNIIFGTTDGNFYQALVIQSGKFGSNLSYFSLGTVTAYRGGWTSEVYRTIEITGGTDATNPTLIAWLEANGTLTKGGGGGSTIDVTYNSQKIIDSLEVTPPVTVTYNGSTIATLNAGDTKTLQCSGKVMASNVVIGDKTLQCNGKLMASDVVVEVSGVTPTGETWVINETVSMPQTDYMEANFVSNNKHFDAIYRDIFGQEQEKYFIRYSNEMVYEGEVSGGYSYWLDEAYRTVTFETPPTGDLLTWLQANAVKQ